MKQLKLLATGLLLLGVSAGFVSQQSVQADKREYNPQTEKKGDSSNEAKNGSSSSGWN